MLSLHEDGRCMCTFLVDLSRIMLKANFRMKFFVKDFFFNANIYSKNISFLNEIAVN